MDKEIVRGSTNYSLPQPKSKTRVVSYQCHLREPKAGRKTILRTLRTSCTSQEEDSGVKAPGPLKHSIIATEASRMPQFRRLSVRQVVDATLSSLRHRQGQVRKNPSTRTIRVLEDRPFFCRSSSAASISAISSSLSFRRYNLRSDVAVAAGRASTGAG